MISIIIPVFNVEEYIRECLESLINQTFDNFQVIIVDDGSTDSSIDIVNELKNRFKDIIVLYQQNKGVSDARNLALNYVTGKYVLYVDPDDFLDKNMLKELYIKAEKDTADIVICEYYFYYGENNKKNYIQSYDVDFNKIFNGKEIVDMMLNYKLQGQLWHKLFRTELLKKNNFNFESGRYIQDVYPVFRIISKSNKIVFLKKALYYYRQRETSTVYKKNMKITDDFYFAMNSIIRYSNEIKDKISKNSLIYFRCRVLINFIMYYTNASESNNYSKFINSKYKKLDVKISEFIFNKNIPLKDKFIILLWKCRIYGVIKKIKNKLKN